MSSRALRRLKKGSLEDELERYQKKIDSNSEESEDDAVMSRPSNAFAFLPTDDHEDDASSQEEDKETKSDEKKDGCTRGVRPILHERVDEKFKKKSQSKKQQKKKNKSKSNNVMSSIDDIDDYELDRLLEKVKLDDANRRQGFADVDGLHSHLSSEESEGDDSVDDSTEEKLPPWPIYTPGGKLLTSKKLKRCSNLLEFDVRDLNPDREYENLFGKLSTAAIDDADSTASSSVSPEVLGQIRKLAKRVRGWSGRDHRSIPGTTRKLKLTKIKDDWLPIPRKPLSMEEMSKDDLLNLYTTKFKNDWKDVLIEDINKDYKYGIRYYNINQGPTFSVASVTEFFMSVVVQPDHESLIRLLQKSPYSIETILQVALILQRQGDNSNTNGLIERALFLFDWSLPNNLELGDGNTRLPFEFFLNRQIYLTIFRYITVLTQKSILFTAFTYCKLLLSFDPREDPYGVRYFIDFYAFVSDEFQYLIDFANSPLCQVYEEWLTAPILYTVSLCYYKLGKTEEAREALKNAYIKHPYVGHHILEKLGDYDHPWLLADVNNTVKITTALYLVRLDALVEDSSLKSWLVKLLRHCIETIGKPNLNAYHANNLEQIPVNLLRHAVLSNESSVMAKIPESFWSENDVYEFDVLPPKVGTTIYNYVDENQISAGVMSSSMQAEEIRQFENLLQQQIRENN
ncbi:uncharacterized protein C5L36_0B07720 [Pichia kudriavzevii]|uniref:Ribosome quality control complex subunit 1 n=1 Tax=Pichia kudriavzevii TaxID=4909 RepID=A0A2U9R2L6_PICKU|nr:uncharacterized protein C5L36_0B07720 [Pichia kudriavzevii]AWU75523.1 hypothetical protein C5L36_0B07720 [Pichia kudriavzevii]